MVVRGHDVHQRPTGARAVQARPAPRPMPALRPLPVGESGFESELFFLSFFLLNTCFVLVRLSFHAAVVCGCSQLSDSVCSIDFPPYDPLYLLRFSSKFLAPLNFFFFFGKDPQSPVLLLSHFFFFFTLAACCMWLFSDFV